MRLPVFIAALLLVLPASGLAQALRADRPTYTIGEKSIRPSGVFELIRIENGNYVFSAEGGREQHFNRDLGLVKSVGPLGMIEFDPGLPLEWPLQVGKGGSRDMRWQTSQSGGFRPMYVNWKIESYEDVKVPAGHFKAFKISYEFQVGPPGMQEWRDIVLWYAPDVRQYVKMASASFRGMNMVIVAVDRPELAPLQLALRDPKDQARLNAQEITVTGKATSGKGIARVSASLNGAEIFSHQPQKAPETELLLEFPARLREGRNVLIVTATDSAGEARQEARTLFYEKAAPAAPAVVALPYAPAPGEVLKKPLEGEQRQKSAEASLRAEEDKRRAEEQRRLEEARRKAEELAKTEQLRRQREEQARRQAEEERKKAEELARLEQEKRRKAEELASLPPMQITISSPRDQARLESESIALAGLAMGGRGVRRVVVALNGAELKRWEEAAPQRSMAVNLPVKLREGQNTLVITAADVDGTMHQEVRTVYYEKPAPLSISFRYPEDRSKVNEDATLVAAVVTSSKGVSKVSVSLNGAEVHRQSERAPQKSVAVTVPLTLKEGANAIVLQASEPDGNVRQEIRTVIYEPVKGAQTLAKAKTEKTVPRNLWAVVIGVGRYESAEIPRLRYTVPDAEAIYQVLTGPAGFKKEHVLLLSDRSERKPTLRNIKWALGTFLARSARKDDTVLIFFAGHGAPEVDPQGVERDGFAKYLVPSDADPDDLYSTAMPMDELQTIFARIEAERVVVFLDACYSGAAGGRTFTSKKTRSAHVDDLFLERVTRSKGRALITASRPSEVSIELPEFGHGIFTYYLLQGLKGAGDLNRDGIVTLQELYEYVEQQVTQKSRSVGGNQHPVMKGEMEGILPLVKVRAQ